MQKETRTFKKLRISLTEDCNLACSYCVSEDHNLHIQKKAPPLKTNEILRIVESIHRSAPLDKIRLTGGEPLLFGEITGLIKGLKKMGIQDIGLTTNAYYLSGLAGKLKRAGLTSINVSLDALNPDIFKQMTRKPLLAQTLKGIDTAQRYGFDLKINTVVLKGVNENEILPLLQYGKENEIPVRFLELMKMGYLHHNFKTFFLSQKNILERITQKFEVRQTLRETSSTARYWELQNHSYKFGIIANESAPFCADCDRLRLDSYGNLFGCISATKGIEAKSLLQNQNAEPLLKAALKQKQQKFSGSTISMRYLGG